MEQLNAAVQNYDWGDPAFLADLQGRTPSGLPEAELWMGGHPAAPSWLESSNVSLPDHISSDPLGALGPAVQARFGELPFLAKILAAARPLSLQTHPSKSQAEAGYRRESQAGIPLDSPERIYRDTNHKPELICALTDFEAKSGFAHLAQSREVFDGLEDTALAAVADRLGRAGTEQSVLADTLGWLLREPTESQQGLVDAAVSAAERRSDGPHAAAWAWVPRIASFYPGDVGPVISLLLNHVVLQPGQAMYLPAGNLHSYLAGCGVEIMANSDNVIRCGLTSKHVDVDELLDVVDATPIAVEVQQPIAPRHRYTTHVDDFELERILVEGQVDVAVTGPEILIPTGGMVTATAASGTPHTLSPGHPLWVDAAEGSYALDGAGTVFRATTALTL